MSDRHTIVVTGNNSGAIRSELEASYALMLDQFPDKDWGEEANEMAIASIKTTSETAKYLAALANLAATELRIRALQKKSGQDN